LSTAGAFSRVIASSKRKVDMSDPAFKSARIVAAEVLGRFDSKRAHAGPILDRLLPETDEKQRATDLVFGAIRNLIAIDRVIGQFSGRPVARIDSALRAIIRVGVYELVYSPETPVYSIVNEAVENTRRTGGKKQTGFVNAVLRSVLRHIAERQTEPGESTARRTLVRSPETGCEFDAALLPDPTSDPATFLSACFSIPPWLAAEWVAQFGPQQAREIALGSNRKPSVYIRVNTLKIDPAHLLERFQKAGVRAEAVGPLDGNMLRILGPQAIAQLPGFAEGSFVVQDLSASGAVRVLDPQPGWTILDLCAAPGTKTTQLAEVTRDEARIVATDIDAERLTRVTENISRLGCRSVTVVPYAEIEPGEAGRFDAILLDVPCSNTGVLARRVEVRHRVRPDSIAELAGMQLALLKKAAKLLADDGKICYSTCSIQKGENGDLVRRFLSVDQRFELAREELTLPSAARFDRDGAYVAILRRR
jgi:16S rRNA (cytosine967-C5)-methyltransferase